MIITLIICGIIIATLCGKLSELASSKYRAGWPWCILFVIAAVGTYLLLGLSGAFHAVAGGAPSDAQEWIALGLWAAAILVPFFVIRSAIDMFEVSERAPKAIPKKEAGPPVTFTCIHCKKDQQISSDKRGRVVPCTSCSKSTRVPESAPLVDAPSQ
jgi:hypothetical protein